MGYDLVNSSRSAYSLHYRPVLVVKYRRDMFAEERNNFIHGVIEGFEDNYGVELERLEAMATTYTSHSRPRRAPTYPSSSTPSTGAPPGGFVTSTTTKSRTSSGEIRLDRSYCLISTGQVSLDVLLNYVDSQREDPPNDR